jgi:hypothetical protein
VAVAAGPLIHLGTRCGSIDEFVERFAPFATEDSLVMPTASEVAPGTEGRFVIHLKDRTPVMSGRCRVEEVRPVSGGGGSGRMVMRVRLLGMDEPSRNVHKQLLACKRPPPAPPAAPAAAALAPKPPSLRIVRSSTLLGTSASPFATPKPPPGLPPIASATSSAAIGTAATLIGTIAPPLPAPQPPPPITGDELEKTAPSIKVPETQAPSAAFTLPANPLSDLEANDLASFIECTLFESQVDPDAAPESEPEDDGKAPNALTEDAADAPAVPGPVAPRTTAIVSRTAPAVAVAEVEALSPQAQMRARMMHAAPYALCTVIGVLVGALLRSSASQPPPARPAHETHAAPAPAAVAPEPPTPAPAAVAPAPAATPAVPAPAPPRAEPAAAAAAEAPAPVEAPTPARAGSGSCAVSVASEPPEAQVLWGAKLLGHTPLKEKAVPCGAGVLTLRHERYKEVKRAVSASPASPLVVSERLHRPNATLMLTSSPPRAIFTVNQLEVGPAPRKVNEWRYETIHVEAKLPGYLPWKRTLYLREEVTKLSAQLVSAKPDTRGAMRMPGRR